MSKSIERARIILSIARARRDKVASNARMEVANATAELATAIAVATCERIKNEAALAEANLTYSEQRLIALDTDEDTMTIDLHDFDVTLDSTDAKNYDLKQMKEQILSANGQR